MTMHEPGDLTSHPEKARTPRRARLSAAGGDDRALIAAVFENAAMGIALVDMDGHPVESNPALQRMLGYGAAELREMAFTEFTHPDDASADWDLFQELVAGARAHYPMHKRYIRKDGTTLWGRLIVTLIRSPDGAPRYAVGMVEDVSERRQVEERYRALVEQLPGIVYRAEFGHSGRWHYASPFSEQLLGFPPGEWTRDPDLWWRQVYPEDRARVIAEERRSRDEGRPFACEYRMQTRAGETVWVYDVATVIGEDPRTPLLQGVILDITKQKDAEGRLAESEAMLRAIVESEPECVKLVAPDGELLTMNPAGLRMIEADSADEVIGTSVYEIVAPEHRPAFRALTEAAVRGHGGRLEFDIIGLRGTRRSMETHAAPLRDATGGIVACLSITRDVSERKRAQAELEGTKGELLEIFSHELFTPITVIQGAALTFAQRGAELALEDHRLLADGVERASQRLHRLVGNLSAAARLDRERMVLGTKTTRIQDVVAVATTQFPGEMDRLEVAIAEEPIGVEVDPNLASTALVIVLENALDLSDGSVGIRLEPRPGWVVVSVSDHGPGVPDADKESIFEAFTQADPGSTRAHEGIGIGLYLARRIMQAHSGTIEAVDRPGYGAVFELSFRAGP